jgi:glycosyltransferase involved in cell wall biosynthesis
MSKISIITINYNNENGLKKTINSVINQTFQDFQFIVIDGNSEDSSVDIIKQTPRINYWVSEKDLGVYDAQNKGIKKALGDYLVFLNSGDSFYDLTVLEKFNDFVGLVQNKIIYGNSNLINTNNQEEILFPPDKFNLGYFFKNNINHQACFIHKNLFSKYGTYNLNYKICADFDFFFKVFIKEPEAYSYFNQTVCNYELGGLSSNKENYNLVVSEKQSILKFYLPVKVYENYYNESRKEIPLKYRILEFIYKKPLLDWIFKKVYNSFKINE